MGRKSAVSPIILSLIDNIDWSEWNVFTGIKNVATVNLTEPIDKLPHKMTETFLVGIVINRPAHSPKYLKCLFERNVQHAYLCDINFIFNSASIKHAE